MVQVSYRGQLQALTGKQGEGVDAARVKDVLRHIRSAYGPEAWKEAKTMLIVVNGESILLRQVFKTPLKDGDSVGFLPICSGG
jgi:molybdopterin converting factor small subunit